MHCRFEEFAVDTPRNRLIKSTLARLLSDPLLKARDTQTINLKKRLGRCFVLMEGIGIGAITSDAFRCEAPGRNDREDRLVLALCELLFRSSIPMEIEGPAHLTEGGREITLLRRVFERFVARFAQRHLRPRGWKVEPQKQIHWPVSGSSPGMSNYLPSMWLDLRLTSPDNRSRIVVDTKFTNVLTRGKGGTEVFKSAHLYQIYSYLQTQLGSFEGRSEGLLLYPSIHNTVSEHMVLPGQVLRLETVDLSKPWISIEQSLSAILEKRQTASVAESDL